MHHVDHHVDNARAHAPYMLCSTEPQGKTFSVRVLNIVHSALKMRRDNRRRFEISYTGKNVHLGE